MTTMRLQPGLGTSQGTVTGKGVLPEKVSAVATASFSRPLERAAVQVEGTAKAGWPALVVP
jgi:hypothetical protein